MTHGDDMALPRREQSRPVFDELVAWAEVHQPFEAPSSKLGEAIRYLLNHRIALGRFLESGVVPIDNGAVERLHIRAALARNYAESPIMRSATTVTGRVSGNVARVKAWRLTVDRQDAPHKRKIFLFAGSD